MRINKNFSSIYSLILKVLRKILVSINPKYRSKLYQLVKTHKRISQKIRKKFSYRGIFSVTIDKKSSFLMVNHGSLIEEEIFWEGLFNTWESDVGWIWKELCEISEVVYDIGANVGIYSLAAKAINPQIKVYAFEPSIHHFPKLKRNIELNAFNIQCEKIAISNKNSLETFYDLPDPRRNTASLSPDKMKNLKSYTGEILEYKVETVCLSGFIEYHNIKKIDMIKLDIELHEPEAIEGLGIYLLKFKPILIIEVLTDVIANKLNHLINPNEFEIFHLHKDKTAVRLDKFTFDKKVYSTWEWNYLVFHKSLSQKIKKNTSLFERI